MFEYGWKIQELKGDSWVDMDPKFYTFWHREGADIVCSRLRRQGKAKGRKFQVVKDGRTADPQTW